MGPLQVLFTIINPQPSPRSGFTEITDSKIWQTDAYDGVYFNEYVKSNLAQDIFKGILMKGMTGSCWRFKRFDRICLIANSDEFKSVDN